EAIASLREAKALAPGRVDVRYLAGSVYLEAGQPADAVADLEYAAQSAPAILDYRLALGTAYVALRREDLAIPVYRSALPLVPTSDDEAALRGYIARLEKERPH